MYAETTIYLGHLAVRLHAPSSMLALLPDVWPPFGNGPFDNMRVTMEPSPIRHQGSSPRRQRRFEKLSSSTCRVTDQNTFNVKYNLASNEAIVSYDPWLRGNHLTPENQWQCPGWCRGLATALQIALPRFHGMPLHASSFVFLGRTLVAPGKSGTGKTTFANTIGTKSTIHDDQTSIILPRANNAPIIVTTTPPSCPHTAPTSYRRLNIVELRQTGKLSLTPLSPTATVSLLVSNAIHIPGDDEAAALLLENAISISCLQSACRFSYHVSQRGQAKNLFRQYFGDPPNPGDSTVHRNSGPEQN